MSTTSIPTADQFEHYFKNHWPKEFEEKMLMLHYYSPKHTLTTGVFAAAMNWKNFNAINLHYGGFAGRTAEAMGFVPPMREQVSFFADFNMPTGGKDDGHWQWLMRPELVVAIETLGWASDAAKEKYERELRWADPMGPA